MKNRKKIILDTGIYIGNSKEYLKKIDYDIIGTMWNGWELLTSSLYCVEKYDSLRAAIDRYLNVPKDYILLTPINNLVGNYLIEFRKRKERELYLEVISTQLRSILKNAKFGECPHHDTIMSFRSYDKEARKDVDSFLSNIIHHHNKLALKYNGNKLFDYHLAYDIIEANYRDEVLGWYQNQFSKTIIRSKINLSIETPFIETTLEFLRLKHSQGGDAKRNTFNDLMFLTYLNNCDYLFGTKDKELLKAIRATSYASRCVQFVKSKSSLIK